MSPARILLTEREFGERLARFGHTAFRLELQDAYAEPCETGLLEAYLRGERIDPDSVRELHAWFAQVQRQVTDGKRVERVRVQQDPPTGYQRFERYLDRWNIGAGEVMHYLTRERAHKIGLLPAAGDEDWWLFDSSWLIVMRFDDGHRRVENELITDPAAVIQACRWRDLALHHATTATFPGLAA